MTDQTTTDPRSTSPRRSRRARVWFLAATAIVLLVAAGVVIWQVQSRTGSADDAALAYLHALESGESSAVAATGITISDEALDAFDHADSVVSDARVISVEETGSSATARVAFVLGDAEHDAELTLVRSDGRWVPDDSGLADMAVSQDLGTAVAIGDTLFDTADALSLIPAVYRVAVAPTAYLSGSVDVVALPGAAEDVAVEASMRPEATDAAQQQLEAILDDCAAETTIPAEGCGIRIPWGTEFASVDDAAFRVEAMPAVVLADDSAGFTAGGGELVATLTGTDRDGNARTTTYRSENWAVRGDVMFDGNEMTLTVW